MNMLEEIQALESEDCWRGPYNNRVLTTCIRLDEVLAIAERYEQLWQTKVSPEMASAIKAFIHETDLHEVLPSDYSDFMGFIDSITADEKSACKAIPGNTAITDVQLLDQYQALQENFNLLQDRVKALEERNSDDTER